MKLKAVAALFMVFGLSLIACGKKDEGGAPACPPAHLSSPAFGTCVAQGQCPQGLVQNPQQPSMCADPLTGQSVMEQRCGSGFFLTAHGCYQQGPCNPGQALRGDVCVNVVSTGSYGGYGNGYNTGYGNGYNTYPQLQTNPYGYQNQFGYGTYANPYYGYRGY